METSIRCWIDALRQARDRYETDMARTQDLDGRLIAGARAAGEFSILVGRLMAVADALDVTEAESHRVPA